MKTRAELAEDLCKAVDKWFSPPHDGDNVAITPVLAALIAWRNAPTDPPELRITPGPMILSDKLSDEEVWMRTVESAAFGGMWHGVTNIANNVLDAFRERFRKEPK